MTRKPSTNKESDLEPTTNDFTICTWMIDELHLVGSGLVLFAYIYAQTMNNMHPSTTSLLALTRISGLTKQTVSRAIDKLPYIIKNASQDNDKGFYYQLHCR